MPAISIVVPIYKVEKFLCRCLDSVLAQTFKDFEVICINDGSPDSCGKLLEEYAKKDARIKIITQKNQGLSVTRNNGLKEARGKYVLFLDSDDCIHPKLLEITWSFATKYDADIVSFDFAKNYNMPNGDIYYKLWNSFDFDCFNKLKHKITNNPLLYFKSMSKFKFLITSWSKLYKKDFIDRCDFIAGIYFEDYPHTISLLKEHPKTVLLKEKLYYYTCNPNSITKSALTPKHIQDYHKGLCFIDDAYKDAWKSDRNFVLRKVFPKILRQQFSKIRRGEACLEVWRAFREELLDLKSRDCLGWRGHKIINYLAYKKLMRKDL